MNKNKFKIIFFLITIAGAMVFSQSTYPADTLLASKDVSFIKKMGILPIAGFQRLSYNLNSMNCQFHPSCSNYGAQAITEFGIIRGTFVAADRVVRCNPTALEYHLKSKQNIDRETLALIDPVLLPKPDAPTISPALAVALSTIIPGSGRMYAGRWFDGIFGFTRFLFYASLTAYAYENEMNILAGISGGITLIVYGGEIYGAYRTAKYY